MQIPRVEQLAEIAAALDMDLTKLITGVGPEENKMPKNIALKYYYFLDKEKQSAIDTDIMNAYYRQLYEKEHEQNPDDILPNNHIINANPRKKPLWTKTDAEKFEKEAKIAFEEAAKAGLFKD